MNKMFTKYHVGGGRVLHHFTSANDALFHDHLWPFRITILAGGYVEVVAEPTNDGTLALMTVKRLPGVSHDIAVSTIHKLTRLLKADCWTLIEPNLPERKLGFYKVNEAGVWHLFWDQRIWRLVIAAGKPT